MFEVITKPGEYTLVDQKKEPYWSEEEYREGLNELLEKWREGDTPYLSLLMDTAFAEELTGRGFQVVSTIVEHEKSLGEDLLPTEQSWQTLEAVGKVIKSLRRFTKHAKAAQRIKISCSRWIKSWSHCAWSSGKTGESLR